MAEATIPVTTPIKEEKGMDDFKGCLRQGQGSTGFKSVCSQEVVTDLLPETQSLLNVPNGDLVAVKLMNRMSKQMGKLHRPGMTDELL
ncbi:hypothetical protein TNCV_3863871 [Trichonephila clavipes]|nr:hypothetical protein TNCV_3863871 [Trichonephila clavipes]